MACDNMNALTGLKLELEIAGNSAKGEMPPLVDFVGLLQPCGQQRDRHCNIAMRIM